MMLLYTNGRPRIQRSIEKLSIVVKLRYTVIRS